MLEYCMYIEYIKFKYRRIPQPLSGFPFLSMMVIIHKRSLGGGNSGIHRCNILHSEYVDIFQYKRD